MIKFSDKETPGAIGSSEQLKIELLDIFPQHEAAIDKFLLHNGVFDSYQLFSGIEYVDFQATKVVAKALSIGECIDHIGNFLEFIHDVGGTHINV